MTVAWRIVKRARARGAFSGEGARLFGGRWNLRGTPAVYLSESLALAALEVFVHLGPAHRHIDLVSIRVDVPDTLPVDELDTADLPADWRSEPPPRSTQQLGNEWIAREGAALLRVPSVLIPQESNLLVDPLGPGADELIVGVPQPFGFDPRMWK
jgi:RES domain-containing protein